MNAKIVPIEELKQGDLFLDKRVYRAETIEKKDSFYIVVGVKKDNPNDTLVSLFYKTDLVAIITP